MLPKLRCASRRRGAIITFATEIRTIPIFPLNTVAFPAAAFPLHIFEARYRVLFNTLLKGADGLEEGLIQDDSPFAGTRRFGMCWSDSKGAIAAIGTTLQIESHVRMDDGRLGIENKGIERFKVLRICEERPVLICEVEVLEEDDDSHPEVVTVADEVRELFRTLIRLHVKKGTIKVGDEEYEPEELKELGPRDLSYWIASNFREMPQHQQILLQENSTLQRLKDEKAVLEGSVNYLRARLAVESAFTSDSSEGSTGSEGSSEGPGLTER
ncbi:g4359 [Coccomyxa elongata]